MCEGPKPSTALMDNYILVICSSVYTDIITKGILKGTVGNCATG